MLSLIVAMDGNNLIGNKNGLPWDKPEDLQYFKKITNRHTVVMDEKTYKSIGRPLPNRHNIVLADKMIRKEDEQIFLLNDLDDVIRAGQKTDDEVFIIGGASMYKQTLPFISRLYIIRTHQECEGDVNFPSFDLNHFDLVLEREGKGMTFFIYERKEN